MTIFSFFFNDPATTEIYTLSLHDALPISWGTPYLRAAPFLPAEKTAAATPRSEEHTSELQSLRHLVCRLLLEKKKWNKESTNEINEIPRDPFRRPGSQSAVKNRCGHKANT